MKFFLIGALALSTVAPSLLGMEAARHYVRQRSQDATQKEINNAEACSICQENFDPEYGSLRVLRCNQDGVPHIFHRQCINDWLLSRQAAGHPARCPICQSPAVPEASRKEQIIANLKNIEPQHNPFNQNNRKFTAQIAALSLTTSSSIFALYVALFAKFQPKDRELKPLKSLILVNLGLALCHFIPDYILTRYVYGETISDISFFYSLKTLGWLFLFYIGIKEHMKNNQW